MNNTSSDLMMENKGTASACASPEKSAVVLPSAEMQKFLLDVLTQINYPGTIVEFVVDVKRQIAQASIQRAGGDA